LTKSGTLSFAGIVTLIGKSLALTGDFAAPIPAPAPASAAAPDAPKPEPTFNHTRFFIGGSWDNPFISPIISQ